MAYDLIIKEEALADTIAAYLYYEGITNGLGNKFLTSLQSTYDKLAKTPESYSYTDNRKILRDAKLKGFPYLVIYSVSENSVIVYVIHNSHEEPKRL